MTPIEKAVAHLGGNSECVRQLGVSWKAFPQWLGQGFVPAEYCPRIEQLTGVRCEELNDRVDWSLIRGTAPAQVDHAAELRRAISETRIVFESEPIAGDALNYLEAVLTATAPVPAQTGSAGGSAAPVAGTDYFAALQRTCARQVAADKAAAAMAAESAQLVADAERSVGARAEPLTLQQVDKVEDRMLALLAKPLTREQREMVRADMVAEFRALNAMGVQPPAVAS